MQMLILAVFQSTGSISAKVSIMVWFNNTYSTVENSSIIQTSHMAGHSSHNIFHQGIIQQHMVESGTRASVIPSLCRLAQACRGFTDTLPASMQENLRGGDPPHRWIRTTDEWQAYDKYCRSKGWRGASVPSMCGFLKNQVLAILRLNFEVEGSREMVQKYGLLWLSENGYIGQDCIRQILSVADGLVEAGAVQ